MEPIEAAINRAVRDAHIALEYHTWGHSLRRIAEHHNLSWHRVWKILQGFDDPLRHPGRPETRWKSRKYG